MYCKHKVPISIKAIAKLMNMLEAEVREWPYLENMRDALKDYNFGVFTKQQLVEKLNDISVKCAEAQIYHYSQGIDKAVETIKVNY